MNRITEKQLQALVDRINEVTHSPMEPWTLANGKFTANIGNYHLDSAYSGYGLARMVGEGGGESSIFSGFSPKRELYEKLHAFLRGIEAAKAAA